MSEHSVDNAQRAQKIKAAAELQQELRCVVAEQLTGSMDWVRAKTYWQMRLPHITHDELADALAEVLVRGSFQRKLQSRHQRFG
ncbi:hypothetical protein [Pseudomonas sp. SLFW]|uniref:hypothetical protein n=1 Tax=Pseudomonas sp. SLFW TaxID=2683259 RepID=UPI001412FFD7|nr:hypothetical protein [Pseudomonas sp. SLFW]NBB09551.1 hypothetical protein [Pseudomonas sp. SLFW]